MAGEKEIVEETTEETTEVTQPEPQSKVYTQEEIDALLAQIKEESTKQYQGLQKVISRKDQEIEKLRSKPSAVESPNRILGALTDELSQLNAYTEDPTAQTRINAIKAEIRREEERQSYEARMRKQQEVANTERDKINQKIRDAGYDPDDDLFVDIEESFEFANAVDGKFERVHRKLDRILKTTKPAEVKGTGQAKETEDQRIDRKAEEKYRAKLEAEGLLETETGGPSASASNFSDLEQKYIQGKVSDEEYTKARVKAGKF